MVAAFRRSVYGTLFSLFLFAGLASGQTSGRLSGSVADPAGAMIANAKLELRLAGSDAVVASLQTGQEGAFAFPSLRPAAYDLSVEAPGFAKELLRNVKIDASLETVLPVIRMSVSTAVETVDVSASVTAVQTSNAEIANTVSNSQIRQLPQLNRNPLALIGTQAGVIGANNRTSTTINGLRVTYNNVTIDGINIQDNFIRTNALDYTPNLPLIDQIAEVTISTSNANASQGGGVGQVMFVTPSGTNQFHGAGYWYNRNNALAANDWFNNRNGIALPFLNQNQLGGKIGGPILKNKLFFFFNGEGLRLRQQTSVNRTILTDDARNGIFTYVAGGAVRKVNLLQTTGYAADSEMQKILSLVPKQSSINNFDVGDSTPTVLRNTAGYAFVRRTNRSRENVTGRVDYQKSEKNAFFGTYIWNRDILDRPTVSTTGYTLVGSVSNNDARDLLSTGWRWTPSGSFTNELRGGFNLAPASFINADAPPAFFASGLVFSNPYETLLNQGRTVNTYNFLDNASWMKGKHQFNFGMQVQLISAQPYNDASIVPTYNLAINNNYTGLNTTTLPGAAASDITAANNLLANLAGLLNTAARTFNVKDRTSGFVPGQTNARRYRNDTYAGFFQDTWRVRRGLTLNLGVRYDYYARVTEEDSLFLSPILINDNPITTLLSDATLDFAGASVGKPVYRKDLNNFAPNLGLAWDIFGDGKTSLRAGYGINYVNDNHVRTIQNVGDTNSGLSLSRTDTALNGRLASRPEVSQPAYKVPRTFRDNFLLNPNGAFAIANPNLSTPYIQQWNVGIQRQVGGGVLEVRYVGNKGTQLFRGFDYNQVDINTAGFLADFRRAQNNGRLSQAAGLAFNPSYAGPGSQPLTVFPLLGSGGSLTNATVLNLIQTGQVGELGAYYQQNAASGPRSNSPISFFRNGLALGANMTNNYSNSTYNGFQVDYSKRFASGFQFQTNYVFSKSLSDAEGTGQTGFEAFLDANNAAIEKAPTSFNIPHAWKTNLVYELPFGKGKKLFSSANGVVDRIISGWSIGAIGIYQSGNPFSIFSNRATLNRDARSNSASTVAANTAHAILGGDALKTIVSERMSGTGPYIIAASALFTDGRAVPADGAAAFQGQVFYNPDAGTLGSLQRRMFNGPNWFNGDLGIIKSTRVTERQAIEMRMEMGNAMNNAFFYSGDQNINSTTFGRMTSVQNAPRRIQFGLYYRF